MKESLDVAIRRHLARYLDAGISLEDFKARFVHLAWNIGTSQVHGIEMVHVIELRLAEHSNGDWTEEELKAQLRPLLTHVTVQNAAGASPQPSQETHPPRN